MIKYLSIILIIIITVLSFNTNERITIPDEALRLRIIANSNSDYDQDIKKQVKSVLEKKVYNVLNGAENISDARTIINNNLNDIDKSVYQTLKNKNYELGYKLNFGYNYFPEKQFMGVTYKEGYYESLLVTLGAGEGDNWWCVLFPPLCLLEAEESTEVEYKFFIKELIDKYL
jgi:stage II sporulation protein R